jgi:hypothetical protein
MKPDDVHSVLLAGPREIQKSSFLFQVCNSNFCGSAYNIFKASQGLGLCLIGNNRVGKSCSVRLLEVRFCHASFGC